VQRARQADPAGRQGRNRSRHRPAVRIGGPEASGAGGSPARPAPPRRTR